jgi:hypothetical protein
VADFCKCSYCGSDLRGAIIKPEDRHFYGGNDECEYGCGGELHYSRLIGIYDRVVDRTVAWLCPDCGYEEKRHA